MAYVVTAMVCLILGFIAGFLAGGKSNRSKQVYDRWENLRNSA